MTRLIVDLLNAGERIGQISTRPWGNPWRIAEFGTSFLNFSDLLRELSLPARIPEGIGPEELTTDFCRKFSICQDRLMAFKDHELRGMHLNQAVQQAIERGTRQALGIAVETIEPVKASPTFEIALQNANKLCLLIENGEQ
jgi:hypothetical protein